jgi:hypothetical protein
MISRIHSKLGTAGLVVAIVALVVALTGVAFAASGLNSKQKKEVKNIAKQYAGKNGAPGAAGPAGPQGAPGPKGDKGDKGDQGIDGKQGKQGNVGPEGSPWTAGGTLPSGETETGAWGVYNNSAIVSMSFNIPLASAPTAVRYVNPSGEEKVFNPALPGFEFVTATHCTGTVEAPTAPAGEVCVYAEQETQPAPSFGFFPLGAALKKFTTGATFLFTVEPGLAQQGLGTWAVTAP